MYNTHLKDFCKKNNSNKVPSWEGLSEKIDYEKKKQHCKVNIFYAQNLQQSIKQLNTTM